MGLRESDVDVLVGKRQPILDTISEAITNRVVSASQLKRWLMSLILVFLCILGTMS